MAERIRVSSAASYRRKGDVVTGQFKASISANWTDFEHAGYWHSVATSLGGKEIEVKKRGGQRDGAGRPTKPGAKRVTVRLRAEDTDLQAWLSSRTQNVSEAIRGLIRAEVGREAGKAQEGDPSNFEPHDS